MDATTDQTKKLIGDQVNQLASKLFEKYGGLSVPDDKERFHISGFRVTGSGPQIVVIPDENGDLYLAVYLDPLSPIGQYFGRYCIPFVPSSDFHFDKAHLWIYPADEDMIRIEIRFPTKRLFSQNEPMIEMVYGIQVKACDVRYLEPLE